MRIENWRYGARVFEAGLSLQRLELTTASARRVSCRCPFATIRVVALIYAHALGSRLAGARVFPDPAASRS